MEAAMSFSSDTKVKDIALSHPAARRVPEEARVDYCCGGGKSLHEACVHAGVDSEEILKQLRENSQNVNPSEANWTALPLSDLTAHIKNHHHKYVREAILRINALLDKVKTKHGEHHPELAEIEISFHAVGKEMIMHMQKEEQILFPFIKALDRAANENGTLEPPFFLTIRNPIHAMIKEHDAAGDLVKQIRKASTEYVAPEDACTSYKALFQELQDFERDLHQHVHLENNILFPRAVDLEAAVLCP
jgi:regulator of cell morphogenesis and NO signaling